MLWCYCGQSIKNIKIPLNIEKKIISDEIKVKEIKENEIVKIEEVKIEEVKIDEVEINTEDEIELKTIENNILDEIIQDIHFVINSKQNLIKMIDQMKDISVSQMKKDLIINKYICKKYIINNVTHLVLKEPYNMIIIIDNNQIHITDLLNKIESYSNKKYDSILLDKYWIIECYKILNDEKLIEVKKLLLLDNIPNNITQNENYEIIVENSSIHSSEIYDTFNPSTIFTEEQILNQPN
jgi:hypothetical protein